jgi:hypothetical protein
MFILNLFFIYFFIEIFKQKLKTKTEIILSRQEIFFYFLNGMDCFSKIDELFVRKKIKNFDSKFFHTERFMITHFKS